VDATRRRTPLAARSAKAAKTVAPVRVRRARPGDAPGLAELESRCFSSDLLNRRQFRCHATNPRAVLLVAERGGELIGHALVFFRAGSATARLYSIALAPHTRGLGLGARLLAEAERKARQRGSTSLRLEVRPDNRAAVALYETRGYQQIGFEPGFYQDGTDAWRYLKAL
jgi:ribosomal-protein-alanine acetyltransferase